MAEVAGYMWQRGWAERNAGNISVCLKEMNEADMPGDFQPFFISLPECFPDLAGISFLVTATNRRMRDLARQPMKNAVIIRISDDGNGFNIISHWGKTDLRPTSELATHLAVHSMIARRGSAERVVMHAHITELCALTQFREYCDERKLNSILWGMHPEAKIFIPLGVGLVPYILPGSIQAGEATVKALEDHNAAVWEKHGLFAIGGNLQETFDLMDILAKSASIYFLCLSAGKEPEGLTDSQIDELGKTKF
jgi:rhamnulose-1-phosphate aldolase